MTTVADVLAVLERAYPPALAEDWDTGIGLTCGDRSAAVTSVLLAVDVDADTVAAAVTAGAQLLVTHHPLLFRPVQSVAADTAKGALIHRLVASGVAHYAAHTNADKAAGGVNVALAELLGVLDAVPLQPDPVGPGGVTERPATGSGRVGRLDEPMTLARFARRVADRLPGTVGGVLVAGDPERLVRTVAVAGGAGGSLLDAAGAAGADVLVTSDLSHHVVAEHIADPARPAVVEVAHWAGEWPWLAWAGRVISDELAGSVTVTVSSLPTDPWTLHVPSAR